MTLYNYIIITMKKSEPIELLNVVQCQDIMKLEGKFDAYASIVCLRHHMRPR